MSTLVTGFAAELMNETTEIDINYVANLARIELTREESDTFSKQLKEILAYFQKMNTVDVEGVEPMAHAFPIFNVWEEDKEERQDLLSAEEIAKNAPAMRQGQITIPKVVENT